MATPPTADRPPTRAALDQQFSDGSNAPEIVVEQYDDASTALTQTQRNEAVAARRREDRHSTSDPVASRSAAET